MANYSLQINSRFNPLSFERLIQPYLTYGQEYRALEDAISNLETEASVWENRINKETETKAAAQYKKYADDLRARAYTLATQGLTPGSRRGMLDMKRRYASEITPIKKVYERRRTLADELRLARLKDPSIMFTLEASQMSLDDLLDNPELTYSALSGETLYSKGKELAAAASLRNISYDVAKLLGNYYYTIKLGYGSEAAANFLYNTANIPELNEAIDMIKTSAGTGRLSKADLLRATDYIISGMLSGLTTKESYERNLDKMSAAERAANARALDLLALSAAGAGMVKLPDGTWKYNPNEDPVLKKATEVAKIKAEAKGNGGSGPSRTNRIQKPTTIYYLGDTIGQTESYDSETDVPIGKISNYNDLPDEAKDLVKAAIGDDNTEGYIYRLISPSLMHHSRVAIIPKKVVLITSDDGDDEL